VYGLLQRDACQHRDFPGPSLDLQASQWLPQFTALRRLFCGWTRLNDSHVFLSQLTRLEAFGTPCTG
jgi:hypothetical protein